MAKVPTVSTPPPVPLNQPKPEELPLVKDDCGNLPQPEEQLFRVDLGSHGPKSRHWAKDKKQAWENYRRKHGIIASDHPAQVDVVDPREPDVKPDRLGQVKAEHKTTQKKFPSVGEFDEREAELEIAEMRG
jgi:uncharacterized protein YnzC (UPF0291/DUF896 family)